MFNHSKRFDALPANPKDPEIWNIVGDCAINKIILESGIVFPVDSPPLTFEHFGAKLDPSLSTEQNYFRLINDGESSDSSQHKDCGSGAGGGKRSYELDTKDVLAPAISVAAKGLAIAQVREKIASGTPFGTPPPEELKRMMEDLSKPKVSWRRELAVVMRPSIGTTMGRKDYSMMRLGRREGAFRTKAFSPRLPAMRQPLPPKVSVIMDTSPSMSRELLRDGLSEILGIVRAVGASQSVTVIPCSGQAFPAQEVKRASQVINLDLRGDNSTNLVRGFVAAMEERKKPKIIVVITDGYTPWPKNRPKGVDLVIILLTLDDELENIPKWAKAILIPD
jgi:predicted metal-dependent peptidase